MKKLMLALLLGSLTDSSLAVQTFTGEDDQKALDRGKSARNVVFINIVSPDNIVASQGTGILVRPDLIATCAHLFQDFEDSIKPGVPTKIRGYVDFRADTTKAPKKKSKKVYEFESIITHPGSELADDNVDADFAFIKLKKPVEGITPAKLYQDGLLSPAQLQTSVNDSYDSDNVIKATFTGYGFSLTEVFGKRRTVEQICILDRDEEDAEDQDEGTVLLGFVPPSNLEDLRKETDNPFVRSLFNHFSEDVFGMLCSGDSGGPLTLEMEGDQYLIGVESSGEILLGGEGIQHDVRSFQQSSQLRNWYLTQFTALFNSEGNRHPVVDDMISKLDAFPISGKPRLRKIIKLQRKQNKSEKKFIAKVEADISTLKGLLRDDLTNKKFKKALKTIKRNGVTDLTVKTHYFDKKSKVLKTDQVELFKSVINKVIEDLQDVITGRE